MSDLAQDQIPVASSAALTDKVTSLVGGATKNIPISVIKSTIAEVSAALSGTSWDISANPLRELSGSGSVALTIANAVAGKSRGLLIVPSTVTALTINGTTITLNSGGETWVNVFVKSGGAISYISENATAVSGSVLPTPAAPTGLTVDDAANTLDWTYVSGYAAANLYEYSTDSGSTWTTVSAKPISVGNVAIASGAMKLRVKAQAGVNNAGSIASTSAAFTTSGGTGPTTQLTNLDVSTVSPGFGNGTDFCILSVESTSKVVTADTVNYIKFHLAAIPTGITSFDVRVVRHNTGTGKEDQVAAVNIPVSGLTTGLNTIAVGAPFSVLVGDEVMLYYGNSTNTFMSCVSFTNGCKYLTPKVPDGTPIDFTGAPTLNAVPAIQLWK